MTWVPGCAAGQADPIHKNVEAAELITFVGAAATVPTDVNDGHAEILLARPVGYQAGDTLFVWTMAYGSTPAPVEAAFWTSQGPLGVRSALYMREATNDADDDWSVPFRAPGVGFDSNSTCFAMRASNVLELSVTGTDISQTSSDWPTGACAIGADDDTILISHGARNTPGNPVGSPFDAIGDIALFSRIIEAGGARNIPPPVSTRIRAGICATLYQADPVAIAAADWDPDPEENSDNRNVILRFRITP